MYIGVYNALALLLVDIFFVFRFARMIGLSFICIRVCFVDLNANRFRNQSARTDDLVFGISIAFGTADK